MTHMNAVSVFFLCFPYLREKHLLLLVGFRQLPVLSLHLLPADLQLQRDRDSVTGNGSIIITILRTIMQ